MNFNWTEYENKNYNIALYDHVGYDILDLYCHDTMDSVKFYSSNGEFLLEVLDKNREHYNLYTLKGAMSIRDLFKLIVCARLRLWRKFYAIINNHLKTDI